MGLKSSLYRIRNGLNCGTPPLVWQGSLAQFRGVLTFHTPILTFLQSKAKTWFYQGSKNVSPYCPGQEDFFIGQFKELFRLACMMGKRFRQSSPYFYTPSPNSNSKNSKMPSYPRVTIFQKLKRSPAHSSQNKNFLLSCRYKKFKFASFIFFIVSSRFLQFRLKSLTRFRGKSDPILDPISLISIPYPT